MTASHAAGPPPAVRRIADLPGPRGWPLVGSLFQLRRDVIHQDIERWCGRYGPLFRLRIGRRELVVLSDHALIADVLRDRPDGWRRTQTLQQVSREMGLKPGLFGAEGDSWRAQRRMVMGGLDPSRVRAYFPQLQRVTDRLQRRWERAADEGRALDLQAELMRYTVDTVAGLAFGRDINTLESDGDVIQQHLDRLFPALFRRVMSPLPYWRWIQLPADRALDRSVAEIQRAIAGFIAEARQRLHAEPARREHPPNLLEAMIVAAEEGRSGIGDDQVSANVLTMLLAGEDTTANTLAWLLHLLHRRPEAMARARDEARRVAAGADPLTPEDLSRLEYIDACLSETMRLKPVAPFMVLEALRDTQIADVQVPAGTMLWCAMRHDALQAQHFADPLAFKPERWLGEAAGSSKRVATPFGAGPRMCPGRYLALVEMKMLLVMVLSRFDIQSVSAPRGAEARERMSFTMVPVGLQMRLRRSEHAA
ncbi:MAG: cytochrome P450 [Burkholderiaceae bacterium]|nr:cytochrome P450 [Burkholderiaceae bacterium]